MRKPTVYETYLHRLKDYYRIKQLECPEWVDKASQYYNHLYYAKKIYGEMCSNTAISKSTMNFLANIDQELMNDIPDELRNASLAINSVLKEMYDELISSKNDYFIDEWTLSKEGRKIMRRFVDKIPSVGNIYPPENEFTNVPYRISYSNRVLSYKAEYNLTVSLAGSRICIKNGEKNNHEYIDFTEGFLDRIIPMVQWDNIEHMVKKLDLNQVKDESIYQDYKIALVEVDWNECDLALTDKTLNNIFVEVLKLVWEEYRGILIDKDMVLPWFDVLGLTE